MEAKPGITLVWKDRSGLLESQLLPEKATLFLRPCQARSGAIHQIAVFIKRATAVKPGNKFLRERILQPAAPMSRSIRRIPTRCLPACGIFVAKAGNIDPVATDRTSLPPADCFVQTMAAGPGPKLHRKPIKAFRRSHMAGSRLRSRLQIQNVSIAWLNHRTARCSFPMMAARPGTSETKAIG